MKKLFMAIALSLSLPLTSFAQTDALQQKRIKLIAAVQVIKSAQVNDGEMTAREMLTRGSGAVVGVGITTSGLIGLKSLVNDLNLSAKDMFFLRTSGYMVLGGAAGLMLALVMPDTTTKADTVTEYLKTAKGLNELFEKDTVSIINSIDTLGDQVLVDMIIAIAEAVQNPRAVLAK